MNNKAVDLHDIRQLVEAARIANPESSVVIVADETASSGVVLDLMDSVRVAGVTAIALAAEGKDLR